MVSGPPEPGSPIPHDRTPFSNCTQIISFSRGARSLRPAFQPSIRRTVPHRAEEDPMTSLADDPRIDPRLKAWLANMPTTTQTDVASREALIEELNSPD